MSPVESPSAIEWLLFQVLEALPKTLSGMDPPADPEGFWFLDLTHDRRTVTVQWSPRNGYLGVSLQNGDLGYGEKPKWVSTNKYLALAHTLRLLVFGDV
jgi:hypothetical protein